MILASTFIIFISLFSLLRAIKVNSHNRLFRVNVETFKNKRTACPFKPSEPLCLLLRTSTRSLPSSALVERITTNPVSTHALDVGDFEEMARSHGALTPDQKISPELPAFIEAVVKLCACIGDTYSKDDDDDENAGDHIRSLVPC